jgi:hypothetical protein
VDGAAESGSATGGRISIVGTVVGNWLAVIIKLLLRVITHDFFDHSKWISSGRRITAS